jgi:nitric-oxide synthase
MRWLVRRTSAEAHPPQAVPLNAAVKDDGDAQPDAALPGTPPSDTAVLLAAAERFITQFHAENPGAGAPADRMSQVRDEVNAHGTYRHTSAELTFAARIAWRNSSRCIGRLYWRTLRVRDRRQVREPGQIAAECFTHLRAAANGGRILPMITVFAPDAPGQPGPRILNGQVVSYAGHEAGGAVVGDPAHLEITQLAAKLGWQPAGEPGRFDPLPLIIESSGLPPAWFDVPKDAVFEVPLRHPDLAWFRELRLRWYAIPVISDMYLEAGGIRYPAAPFNGWYMCTEIGSRDLGDENRYNQLPEIAARMGLRTDTPRTLWKDRAVTELNAAVLYSYEASGVRIADHHTESERFLAHLAKEQRHGRGCPADWSWIVPPTAGSTTPVFHRYYEDFDASPNFFRHAS